MSDLLGTAAHDGPLKPAENKIEKIINYIIKNKSHINGMIVVELILDANEGFLNVIFPLLDYIMTTPENFNPNLFREFLTDKHARDNLVAAYEEKTQEETHPIDKDNPPKPSPDPS